MWQRLAGIACVVFLAVACAPTIRPQVQAPKQASFDGNQQNSGFLAWTADGGAVLTPHARDRYNALISVYGSRISPPIKADYGITATSTNTYVITAEALEDMGLMKYWERKGELKIGN